MIESSDSPSQVPVPPPAPVVAGTVLQFALRMADAANHLEHNFVFRKLGVVYDYAAPKGQFPSPVLPALKDVREKIPNAAGLGTGMGDSARLTCILFDAYATRLELGLARPEEDRIVDRLTGGLIRIGTTAPDGRLVRGIAPDGRTHYPTVSASVLTWYAHALWRAVRSSVVAAESQTKLKDITGKWMGSLANAQYAYAGLAKDAGTLLFPADDESATAWLAGIRSLHLVCIAAVATGEARWSGERDLAIDREGQHLSASLPEALTSTSDLLDCAVILADLSPMNLPTILAEGIVRLRRAVAERLLASYAAPTLAPLADGETIDFEWRGKLETGGVSEEEIRTRIHTCWPRLAEEDAVTDAAEAALAIFLSADKDCIERLAPRCEALFEETPWTSMTCARALPAALYAHALGHESGLWDPISFEKVELPPIGQRFSTEFDDAFNKLIEEIARDKKAAEPRDRREQGEARPEKGGRDQSERGGERGERGDRSERNDRRHGSQQQRRGGGKQRDQRDQQNRRDQPDQRARPQGERKEPQVKEPAAQATAPEQGGDSARSDQERRRSSTSRSRSRGRTRRRTRRKTNKPGGAPE